MIRTARLVLLLCAALFALGSCSPVVAQILVFVGSDIPSERLQSIAFSAIRGGASTPIVSRTRNGADATLPLSFGIIADRPDDVRQVIVSVSASYLSAGATMLVNQQAIVDFKQGAVLRLDLQLKTACASATGVRCVADQTCSEGTCIPRVRSALPDY